MSLKHKHNERFNPLLENLTYFIDMANATHNRWNPRNLELLKVWREEWMKRDAARLIVGNQLLMPRQNLEIKL